MGYEQGGETGLVVESRQEFQVVTRRRGDGAMGRWATGDGRRGDRAKGRWGDGAMGRRGDGAKGRKGDGAFENFDFGVDEIGKSKILEIH